MTETQIEAIAERRMDDLDRQYLGGQLTDHQYREAVRALDAWTLARGKEAAKGSAHAS